MLDLIKSLSSQHPDGPSTLSVTTIDTARGVLAGLTNYQMHMFLSTCGSWLGNRDVSTKRVLIASSSRHYSHSGFPQSQGGGVLVDRSLDPDSIPFKSASSSLTV